MSDQILSTKIHVPQMRPNSVSRPRLSERLSAGCAGRDGGAAPCKLTLISAPAGFGKTTLVTEWIDDMQAGHQGNGHQAVKVAWLSLDEGDNDPARFLVYLVAALQTVDDKIGQEARGMLQSGQASSKAVLTSLINEIAEQLDRIVLVLDDYHMIEAHAVDTGIAYLLEHLPPQMHLVIATRDDPAIHLGRLRARGELTELRASDLRFSTSEAAAFLNQIMGLGLSTRDVAALEARTEGWIAGLQLAALSLQGRDDKSALIRAFTGSHRFVLDFLVEEVLEQQSERVQTFLLQTSILDRLSGSLCDALTGQADGQETLEMLERCNLFIVPLDSQRRWYRYHHLFAELLRQQLRQSNARSLGRAAVSAATLHVRASAWYEAHGMEIQAFQHAAHANDVDRATRLIEGDGMPLTFRGAFAPVLRWLSTLPDTVLDARPLLWITYASAMLASGQREGVEQKLKHAESILHQVEPDATTRDLVGRIAATRATLAFGLLAADTILSESRRALEYLQADNHAWRTATIWKLGYANYLQDNRTEAIRAYAEAIPICEATGNIFINIMASHGLGDVLLSDNQLAQAAETYQRVLELVGDQPLLPASGGHLGLGEIYYQWDDLPKAMGHAERALPLARSVVSNGVYALCVALLARIRLAQGDASAAWTLLADAEQFVRQHQLEVRMPDIATAQVLVLIRQGDYVRAGELAGRYALSLSWARVYLAQGDAAAAIAILEPLRREAEDQDLKDRCLQALIPLALAYDAIGQADHAVKILKNALRMAEPGGFVRIFVDEGPAMSRLLYRALSLGFASDYLGRLLSAFPMASSQPAPATQGQPKQSALVEPLSEREIEVLQLIAEGLTNRELGARLFLSLNTVKVHTRNIYGKLGVHSRTQAIARSRIMGILPQI